MLEPTKAIISIKNLRKNYGNHEVLKGIDLDIESGKVIGYIGSNGAGKSTTVRILTGLDNDFQGTVTVNGINVKENPIEVKKLIGYVPEHASLYDVLTPMEFLSMLGKLHHLSQAVITERATKMLNFFGLQDQHNQRMETFSKGMRQKVLLISGLLHHPQIIFLDEPLAGLDANSVILVKDIIARLAAEGKTIFYCSHIMDTVEKVSDRIILLNEGKVAADGTFESLKQQGGESLEKIFAQLTTEEDLSQKSANFMEAFE